MYIFINDGIKLHFKFLKLLYINHDYKKDRRGWSGYHGSWNCWGFCTCQLQGQRSDISWDFL